VPGYPYLLAHADPYDAVANPNHVWTASVTPAQIESYFPAVVHLDDIAILTRDGNGDWGGRVLSVRLDGHDTAGHATAVTTTGAALALVNSWPQRSDGLRGNYFTVTSPSVVPGPAAAASGAGVRLFTQGSSADVVQQVYSGSAWSSGQSLGGRIVGGPWAAAAGTSGLVVVRGVDNALWSRAWQPTGWSGWQTAGGILTSQPAVANNSDGSMLAVARGRDGALWTTTYSAEGAWGPVWTSLGGVLSSDSDPAAVTYGSGELAAVVRAPDGSLWYRTRSASGWSAWLSAGGRSLGPIGATSYSSGRVDVFVRGTDNQVWHRWLAGTWSSWENLGGQAISGVSAVTTADGRLGVFVVGSDHRVWQKTYAAGWSAWSPVP
jgi:hypothetical protein